MSGRKLRDIVKELLEEIVEDIVEERTIEYIVRELHLGRNIRQVINDPYIRNRLTEEKIDHILENPDIIRAMEEALERAFEKQDFKFVE